MARVHLHKRQARGLAPVYNTRCMVEAKFTVKRVYFSFLLWEEQVPSLVDGKHRPKTQNNSLVQDTFSFYLLLMEPPFLKRTICRGQLPIIYLPIDISISEPVHILYRYI